MRSCRYGVMFALAGLALAGCTRTRIEGSLPDAPESEVIVKLLNVNKYQTLDTLRTTGTGAYSYSIEVEEGQPEFVYLFYKDTKIASLLLSRGDRVKVVSDTLGHYAVEGSEESRKLQRVEADYAAFEREAAEALRQLDAAEAGSEAARQRNADLSRLYVQYYRSRVKYLLSEPHSLTCVPVLYQELSPGTPIFSQPTDALHFRAAADSLRAVYPESRYVKALEREAARREQAMALNYRLRTADEAGFMDIELPDIRGNKVKLSALDDKVIMVYFWSTVSAAQKMFNLDSILPIYQDFHARGFEIYAVSLDTDKPAWADAVRSQNLPWINVCDTRGSASSYAGLYHVTSLPFALFIADGEIDAEAAVTDADSMRRYLNRKLR